MIAIVDVASWLISAPGLVMFSTYFTECALGQKKVHASIDAAAPLPSLAILVPAHNEAAGIARTLTALISDMPIGTSLIVIADNCTDATANVVRAAAQTANVKSSNLFRAAELYCTACCLCLAKLARRRNRIGIG